MSLEDEANKSEDLAEIQSQAKVDSEDELSFSPVKRRRRTYLPLQKIKQIFPGVSPEVLCKSAELVASKPIAVLRLVATASTEQLC